MLTDAVCKAARAKDRPYKLTDGRGLFLEVKTNGAKVWRYRFELVRDGERRETVYTLGEYFSASSRETAEEAQARRTAQRLTLADARVARDAARDLVRQGVSPVQQRQHERLKREQDSANTFEAVAGEWLALKDWTAETKARRLDMLARVVFPKIGALPVKLVTPRHVLDVLTTAAEKNGPSVAAEARRTMAGVFELAIATLRADADPVHPVRKALPTTKTRHKRALPEKELGQLLRDLAAHDRNVQTVCAFSLLWLTLARPGEVLGARWDEIDLDAGTWCIPAERMKMREPHTFPLSAQAVAVLRRMQAISGNLAHVFPHRDRRREPMTPAAMRQALKAMGWAGRFSPHAARTTGSTRLNELGYSPDWIERQLAHADKDAVRRTYNRADYLADRTKMMQAWADYLDRLREGAQVLPFKAA